MQRIREMILTGELHPGERITEIGLAERLNISRTPIRNALPALAAEGFLESLSKRGYSVKIFSQEECRSALELRATLEGHAARTLAEKQDKTAALRAFKACLEDGDRLFDKRHLTLEDEELYGQMNARFHQIISEYAGSELTSLFIKRLNAVPFVAPSAMAFKSLGLDKAYAHLFRAHGQHHAIVNAIASGDGQRAEFLLREHGQAQMASLFTSYRED
jgi:GntR family transcriptional regulator, vanillate catabolism transcriptional regulator